MTSIYEVSLGVTCLFLLGALGWSVSLRRRVKEQTEQIRQQVLREAELQNRYKNLFDNANDLIFTLDAKGFFASLNRAAEAVLGLPRNQAPSVHIRELITPEFRELFDLWMENLSKDQQHSRCELEVFGRNREQPVSLEISAHPVLDASRQVIGFEGIARDISQRKKAEKLLKESEERFSSAFRVSPVAIAINTQGEERFEDANESFLRLFEMAPGDLINKTSEEIRLWVSEDERQTVRRVLREHGSVSGMECQFRTKGGKHRNAMVFMEVLKMGDTPCVLFIVHDITERQTLEGHLRQSQKMEAVGRLAAGVAHDFNNLLTVIQGNVELVRLKEQLPAGLERPLSQVSDAAQKAAGLVRQLLTFSRKQVLQPKVLDINELITNCTKVLNHLLPSNILLRYQFGVRLPRLKADAVMMEQILLNLVVNARDAMDKGGEILVRTTTEEIGGERVAKCSQARPGFFLCLSVSDNGCGMDAATQARIYEPFFTTKGPDKGTGLGLATVYGAVQQHQGWIELESVAGKGTTFRIYLPCENEPFMGKQPQRENRGESSPRTVLVAEDDTSVLEFVRLTLENSGCKVIEASSGMDALEKWSQHREEIDLLFTDINMGKGMSGPELAENLRALNPELPIIFTSGCTPESSPKTPRLTEGVNYLAKPYAPPALVDTVRSRLADRPARN